MNSSTSSLIRFAGLCRLFCMTLIFGITAHHAQAQGYQIKAGDTLRIEVLEDASLNRTVLVAPDGRISVPQAGTISVRGQSVETVQSNLTQRLASNFANTPNVFVSIEQLAQPRPSTPRVPEPDPVITVYVLGEVGNPGRVEVEPGTNVLQMFAVMGGFTRFAATKRIQLRRGGTVVANLNYDQIELGGNGGQTTLADGDVIVVPQRKLFE